MHPTALPPTPEVVVFDLGKVLLDFDYRIVAGRVAARGAMNTGEVQTLIDHSPLLFRFETGHISRDQFFREIVARCGYRGSPVEFARDFAEQFTPIAPMLGLHAALRAARIPTFIFSNTNDLAIEHIRERYPFFAEFDGYVLSYEHGAMKPEAKLYEVVERVTGRAGAAILYLDDRLENAEAGRARGWQVIHHSTPEETITLARKLGLPV